jgi:hypothetical protein
VEQGTSLHAALVESGFHLLTDPIMLRLRGSHEERVTTTYIRSSSEPFTPPQSLQDVEDPRQLARVILGFSFSFVSFLSYSIHVGLIDIKVTSDAAKKLKIYDLFRKVLLFSSSHLIFSSSLLPPSLFLLPHKGQSNPPFCERFRIRANAKSIRTGILGCGTNENYTSG